MMKKGGEYDGGGVKYGSRDGGGDLDLHSPLTLSTELEGKLTAAREAVWTRLGSLRLMVNDKEGAIEAYGKVMKYNSKSVTATTQVGAILAEMKDYNQVRRTSNLRDQGELMEKRN